MSSETNVSGIARLSPIAMFVFHVEILKEGAPNNLVSSNLEKAQSAPIDPADVCLCVDVTAVGNDHDIERLRWWYETM